MIKIKIFILKSLKNCWLLLIWKKYFFHFYFYKPTSNSLELSRCLKWNIVSFYSHLTHSLHLIPIAFYLIIDVIVFSCLSLIVLVVILSFIFRWNIFLFIFHLFLSSYFYCFFSQLSNNYLTADSVFSIYIVYKRV